MTGKFFLITFAALCVFQASAAKIKREDAALPTFEDLSKKTTDFLDTLGNQFNSLVNAKDGNELQDILRNNTNNFIAQVSLLTKDLQAQMGTVSSDVSTVIGQAVAKLNETVDTLKKENPDITNKAAEIQEKLQQSFKAVVAETDKVAKSINENTKDIQEDLSKLTKKAYDQVLQTAKAVQNQVHEAANKA